MEVWRSFLTLGLRKGLQSSQYNFSRNKRLTRAKEFGEGLPHEVAESAPAQIWLCLNSLFLWDFMIDKGAMLLVSRLAIDGAIAVLAIKM